MSHMSFIYQMITNGSYPAFKVNYQLAQEHGLKNFTFGNEEILTMYAKHVCILVDKHLMKEYEDYLEQRADEAYVDDHIPYYND